jgi:hypothetical protein
VQKPCSTTSFSPPKPPEDSRDFLNVAETAALLRISPVTLCRWRIEGKGPPFRKFGRRVLYAHADLLAWAESQRRLTTSHVGD